MSDDAQNSIADLGGEMASATAMPASTAAVAIDAPTLRIRLADQLRSLVLGSRLNALLVCVPLAFIAHYGGVGGPSVAFGLSFFGLIPLAKLLGDCTEDIAARTNAAIGALINVTFGNATELIICVTALRTEQYAIITNSLIGSILGNTLLVLGTSLIAAGWDRPLTRYNAHAAQIYTSTLMLTCFAFLVPTFFGALWGREAQQEQGADGAEAAASEAAVASAVLGLSRQIAVAMVGVYGTYIYFQVRSHKNIFDSASPAPAVVTAPTSSVIPPKEMSAVPAVDASVASTAPQSPPSLAAGIGAAEGFSLSLGGDDDDEDGDDSPQYSLIVAVLATAIVAVLMSFLSDMLVDTMAPAADTLRLGFHFMSLVVLPIIGNVAEHASSLAMARKGKLDIAFGVALGSTIQLGMFVMPLMVLVSAVMGRSFDLDITPFIAGSAFAAVVVANAVLSAGSSTWLTGLKLTVAYLVLAMAFLKAPNNV